MEQTIYRLLFFGAGTGSFAVAFFSCFRRHNRGAGGLIFLCLSTGFWAVCEGLLCFGFDTLTNLRVTQVQYLGIVVAPLAMFFFVSDLFGSRRRLTAGMAILLFLPPVATLALAWTNDFHHLIWSQYRNITHGPFPVLGLTHGPAFYGWVAYNYLLMMAVTGVLIHQARRAAGPIRAQAVVLLGVLALVWVANGVYVSGMSPLAHVDPTPLAFAILAAAMAWALFRYGLLDLVPVAKEEIFHSMPDGVVVMDREGRVIDLNPAAEKIFGARRQDAVGKTLTELGAGEAVLPDLRFGEEGRCREIELGDGGPGTVFDLKTSILRDRGARPLGLLQVWHDVSRRKGLELELERMALTDSLTGSYNRRHFMDVARRELRRARRYGHPLALAVMDIDHFKQVNDTYGHGAGDETLKMVVNASLGQLRSTDVFARVGGEEFAVLYVETGMDEAVQVSQRLRRCIAGLSLPVESDAISVTASLGVVSRREGDASIKALFRRADAALYEAKAAGRNRVGVK